MAASVAFLLRKKMKQDIINGLISEVIEETQTSLDFTFDPAVSLFNKLIKAFPDDTDKLFDIKRELDLVVENDVDQSATPTDHLISLLNNF